MAAVVSTVKIDNWDGAVVAGDPVDGDIVRITYVNGAVREKIYWDIEIPEPPVVDQEVALRGELRRLIDSNTPDVIADFTFGNKTYNLTEDVIQQIRDLAGELQNADAPGDYFPIDIVIGVNDALEVVQTINAISTFKTAYIAIMQHRREKLQEARALKQALESLDLAELQAWTDPRI